MHINSIWSGKIKNCQKTSGNVQLEDNRPIWEVHMPFYNLNYLADVIGRNWLFLKVYNWLKNKDTS